VIDADGLLQRTFEVGEHLRRRLADLAGRHGRLGVPRGGGLLIGVDVFQEPGSHAPASADQTSAIVDGLRERAVLIGATGRSGNVLKIRPPLVFDTTHADLLVEMLDAVLDDLAHTSHEGEADE
jgi:4-aminobutyrate aminotransferase-like enzyme